MAPPARKQPHRSTKPSPAAPGRVGAYFRPPEAYSVAGRWLVNGDGRVTSPQDHLEPRGGFGGRPTRKMPGSPLTGDQRPHRLSRPNLHTHPHGTRTPSHTRRMPNLFRLGTQQDAKFHRHMRHPPHVGFQKRPRVPSSPPSFMNLKGQEGSRTGVCAAGLSLKKELASSFMPPPQKRRGLDMWPRGLTPTQEIRGEKGQ